ncbi:MAG: hypothetical protein ACK49K_13985, partial [Bacteroidota bacterium]
KCGAPYPPLRHARERQVVKKPNFKIYLRKNNPKIFLEFTSALDKRSEMMTFSLFVRRLS